MEAVTAFGLAASVLQVIGFASQLLSAGSQIYQAGSTLRNSELEVVLQDLTVLNKRLKSWARPDSTALGPLAEDGQNLEALALESEKIAEELTTTLRAWRLQAGATRFQSLLQALLLHGKEDVIKQQQISDSLASKRHNELVNIVKSSGARNATVSDMLKDIKAHLHFRQLDDRYNDIFQAHAGTFQWAFQEDDTSTSDWSNLYK
ncbi:hypothetical protein EK21DRAFT_113317 [Setomelanomma holmii]|uniref:Fungal N-terminal domain-containing protein n=1 Tax=Setomelanomma holmii TaxID=210430 RepID=A0A9P4H7R8_9PLEO|nr:hypothetical protein EK21DRAFT_113317 [Setomelanomma holmii]